MSYNLEGIEDIDNFNLRLYSTPMVRERDLNLNVGPNRTEADTYRTGYRTDQVFVVSKFEGPKIIRPPRGIRLKLEQKEFRDITNEVF